MTWITINSAHEGASRRGTHGEIQERDSRERKCYQEEPDLRQAVHRLPPFAVAKYDSPLRERGDCVRSERTPARTAPVRRLEVLHDNDRAQQTLRIQVMQEHACIPAH